MPLYITTACRLKLLILLVCIALLVWTFPYGATGSKTWILLSFSSLGVHRHSKCWTWLLESPCFWGQSNCNWKLKTFQQYVFFWIWNQKKTLKVVARLLPNKLQSHDSRQNTVRVMTKSRDVISSFCVSTSWPYMTRSKGFNIVQR